MLLPSLVWCSGSPSGAGRRALDRGRRHKAHRGALRTEVRICEQLATTYLTDPVAAPLYRLPTAAFTAALPQLIGDGALSERQVEDLEHFVAYVEQINRGLDNTHRALESLGNDDNTLSLARQIDSR
jgi:hypothetical protein